MPAGEDPNNPPSSAGAADDVFLYDTQTRTTKLLRGASAGNRPETLQVLQFNAVLDISDDSRYVLFQSIYDDVVPGVWGILEPDPARCREATIDEADFVLMPGVAFDRSGGRLGYGGGFYDRLLAGADTGLSKVAAAFSIQVVDAVPTDSHDVRITTLVTETGTNSTR